MKNRAQLLADLRHAERLREQYQSYVEEAAQDGSPLVEAIWRDAVRNQERSCARLNAALSSAGTFNQPLTDYTLSMWM